MKYFEPDVIKSYSLNSECLQIKKSHSNGFYIYRPCPVKNTDGDKWACYLHRNLTLNTVCGAANFYESLEEAKKYVKMYIYQYGDFISPDEMSL